MTRLITTLLVCILAPAAMAETIAVAAAISMKDVLTKIAGQYKSLSGDAVEFTFGSSGQLAGQIANGAPVDLFISAADKQMDDLAKAGLLVDGSRRVIAGNRLVLVVPADAKSPADSVRALGGASVTRVAVGEPKSVPAGQYAMQALKSAGVAETVREKLLFGTNARQVLDYVQRGEVSAGIVYATDAKVAGDKVRVACGVEEGGHDPIVYPAAVIKGSKNGDAATKFLAFIMSEKGQTGLKEFGFTPAPAAPTKPAK